jgi:hypothetical protein
MRRYLTKIAICFLLVLSSRAQVAFTNGGFEVTLPEGWVEYEAPKALSDLIEKEGELLLYTESDVAKFFVSRFKVPITEGQANFVAGCVAGSRDSAAQRGLKLEQEEFGTFKGAWPRYSYDMPAQGTNLVHTTSIFTARFLYNVQLVGPKALRAELLKTLDAVTLRETPMAMAEFKRGSEPGAYDRAQRERTIGFKIGQLTVFVMAAVIAIWVLATVWRDMFGRRKGPPPLPHSAR